MTRKSVSPVVSRLTGTIAASALVFAATPAPAAMASAGTLEPLNAAITAIAIDPSASATLYVGTDTGGVGPAADCNGYPGFGPGRVLKSTNGGASWRDMSSGLNGQINSLAIDHSTAALYAATSCGIFKSTDGGTSWGAINSGLPQGPSINDPVEGMTALVIDPSNGATLYALTAAFFVGLNGGGVYKTTNGGASWTPINSGLPQPFDAGTAVSLAIDPNEPGTLYVSLFSNPTAVFRTTNGGASWSATGSGLPQSEAALFIDPSNSATVYATAYNGPGSGVYKTTNGGSSWSQVPPFAATLFDVLAIDPTNTSILYAGDEAGHGVFKSTLAGEAFSPVSPALGVLALAIDPAHTATVYAGGLTCSSSTCTAGLLKTMDSGVTWSSLISAPPPPGPCRHDARTLCLAGKRFAVTVNWSNEFNRTSGLGMAIASTDSTGFFYFTDPSNYELTIKILDLGGVFKVFYAELTNLGFTITITDTATGTVKTYTNTPGDCGAIDENAFPALAERTGILGQSSTLLAKRGSCATGPATLCLLNRRFSVTVKWMNQFNGSSGGGRPRSLSDLSGLFSFTDPSDIELVMKMVDFTDRVAFFYGALSDFEYDVEVTDTLGGTTKTYHNPPGNYCGGIDNNAFPP